jgi:predicted  nucleic acid-binding Zn-ribbon protein
MVDQDILQGGAGIIVALGGYLYKALTRKVSELEDECDKLHSRINANEILLVGQYVKMDRFEALEKALFNRLDRFEDKLDDKLAQVRKND